MDKITEIKLFDGDESDVFAPNPDDYEQHALIGNCIRGVVGDVVPVHKNDLAVLRANKLIASDDAPAKPLSKAAQAKAEKAAADAQAKAEVTEPAPAADLPAIPNLADLPGV